jgi:hypothetical protein
MATAYSRGLEEFKRRMVDTMADGLHHRVPSGNRIFYVPDVGGFYLWLLGVLIDH